MRGGITRKPKALFIWTAPHAVWNGYFDFFKKRFDTTIVLLWKKEHLRQVPGTEAIEYKDKKGIKRAMRETDHDIVVIYHLFILSSWYIMLTSKKPIIILESIHLDPLAWKRKPPFWAKAIFRAGVPIVRLSFWLLKLCRNVRIVCMTRRSHAFMQQLGFKDAEFAFIPYKFFYGTPKPQKRGRKFKLLYVGRFTEMKNLLFLLDTIAELKQEGVINKENFTLTMIGGGGDEDKNVKARMKRQDVKDLVTFISNIPQKELKQYYSSHDLFIITSFDVLGCVTLEAIENGLPTLICEESGFSSFCKTYAKELVFPHDDQEKLKQRLKWAISHRKELAQHGKTLQKQLKKNDQDGRNQLERIMKEEIFKTSASKDIKTSE